MYQPHKGQMTTGVHLVTLGLNQLYKPWFFDGSIVYWGAFCDTESAALKQAEILRDNYS